MLLLGRAPGGIGAVAPVRGFAYLIMKCVYLKNDSFIRDDVTIACEKTSRFLYKFEWDENKRE